MQKPTFFLAMTLAMCVSCAAEPAPVPNATSSKGAVWPMDLLNTPPRVFETSPVCTGGIERIYYEGLPYKGRPTRIFAYCGVPKGKAGKVPGMVLVHGGGGSAFRRWVRFWNEHGYAAISMDTCGCISGNEHGDEQRGHTRHEWAGPAGWGGFNAVGDQVEDQWMFHAVAAAIRGHSLLRSLPGVDAERIGITGVSWGGMITCIAGSLDSRFRFAAPVYGCGDVFDKSPACKDWAGKMSPAMLERWRALWDPIVYLPQARIPFFWLDGTNDRHFSLPALMSSYRAVPAEKGFSIRVRMQHAHSPVSEEAPELLVLANHHLRGKAGFPRFGEVKVAGRNATCPFTASPGFAPKSAMLDYTCDAPSANGFWFDRTWKSIPAVLSEGRVSAELPQGTQAFYLNLDFADGSRASTPVVVIY